MNDTTVVDMHQFVQARAGRAFTTSQNVAEAFGKQHYHVLAKVRELECSDHFLTHNFSWVQFEHRGNTYDAVEMTKDGFMFLVMGFTGKKAAAIKEGYIGAFNWMADQLGISSQELVEKAAEEAIGKAGAQRLSNVMRCRVAKMDAADQRSATSKLASAVHACFGVPRLELIPAGQFDAAANFIASYAIEGEYLGREEQAPQGLNLHFPVEELAKRRPGMLVEKNGEKIWADITLHDLRDLRDMPTPCESIIYELDKAGYKIDGAWLELRTYRNKLRELASFVTGLNRVIEDPQRYAINVETAA